MPNPICHRLCSYDSLLSNLNDPSLLVCLAHINRLVECASGMLIFVNFNLNYRKSMQSIVVKIVVYVDFYVV